MALADAAWGKPVYARVEHRQARRARSELRFAVLPRREDQSSDHCTLLHPPRTSRLLSLSCNRLLLLSV
eukprot:301576-Pleurochrysis_carterae.AAC.1